ncbi:MAG TPA: DUF5995 family protein [Thermomicrobiales bacterium]|nr:DUF5995 family protein [Thermomicrobiales bacterium]
MAPAASLATPDLDRFIAQMDGRLLEHAALGDARERFLLMYRTFKNELRRNLQAGRFSDTPWSEAICCRMAEMYFEADSAYQIDPPTCPEPWSFAFDAARSGKLNLLQDMLLGMNAHINYDLPICAYDTMRLFGDVSLELPALRREDHGDVSFDALLRSRYHDFLLINQIAWESIAVIQEAATTRFSRVLGIAARIERTGPVQLSRLITTRVITEYRDRAWGHAILLLMAEDVRQLATVRQLMSRFAMDAADLVTRVDFHPVRSWQLLRRGSVFPGNARRSESVHVQSVVPFLVDRLDTPSTRRIARRALIDVGPVIQPRLCVLLERYAGSNAGRDQLLQVIAAHPTPVAASALQLRVTREPPASGGDPLLLLAALRLDRVALDIDHARFERSRELALWHARWTAGVFAGLGVEFRGSLLDEVLRHRQVRFLRRLLLLGVVLNPDRRLMDAAESLSPALSREAGDSVARAIDTVVPGAGDDLLRPLVGLDGPETARDRDRAELQLSQICFHTDPWIRSCALHRVGDLGSRERLHLIVPGIDSSEPRVQEAALQACAALLPMEDLRTLIEPLLSKQPVAWVAEYAERLAQGSGSEDGMYSTIEKVLLLKNAELFVDIPAEDLSEIAEIVQSGAFRKDRRLITAGEPGDALYLLVRGEVDVLSADGRKLARVTPYAVLGETSILLDEPCSATCVAATSGQALRIRRVDFERILLDYPDVTLGLLRVMTRRMQAANRARDPVASIVS